MSGFRHPGLGSRARGAWCSAAFDSLAHLTAAYELDRRLVRGADPIDSDDSSLRVGQLGSARMPPLRRAEIQSNRALLQELADALSDG